MYIYVRVRVREMFDLIQRYMYTNKMYLHNCKLPLAADRMPLCRNIAKLYNMYVFGMYECIIWMVFVIIQ